MDRRDDLRRAQAPLSCLPDGQELSCLPLHTRRYATDPEDESRTPPGAAVVTPVVVAAAVIERDGCFLVTKRQVGVHLEGHWEFPGGKRQAGEGIVACLSRELREELDIEVDVGDEIFTTAHAYSDRTIELHFFSCALRGSPRPQIGQEMMWVTRDELAPEIPARRAAHRLLVRAR